MKKRLYRSRTDTMIGGVSAGIANYFDIDTTIVRLLWLGSLVLQGSGLILYFIAWMIIPLEPEQAPPDTAESSEKPSESEEEGVREKVLEAARRASHEIEHHIQNDTDEKRNSHRVLGWVFILAGLVFFLRNMFSWLSFDIFLPLGLVAVGLFFIIQEMQDRPDRKDS